MAARKRKTTLSDSWKEKIRTSMLINRLNSHIFEDVEISQTQMRAIEILLRKVAPDLKAVEVTGNDDNPLAITTIERVIVDPYKK
jgi:urease alpha subunit